jgi:3-methyladenine DNA glycosylase Tag
MEKHRVVEVFELVEATLVQAGDLPENPRGDFHDKLGHFVDEVRVGIDHDNSYFKAMSFVVFFSGFRASTVLAKGDRISYYFGRIEDAAVRGKNEIAEVLADPGMIRNRNKVTACCHNAREFLRMREEYGSFGDMLLHFGRPERISLARLEELLAFLMKRFKYMGPATASHFLLDYGYPVIKPDRMVMRVLHRTGLLPDVTEQFYASASEICRDLAHTLSVSIRYVDWVLVGLGMEGRAGICRKTSPLCNKCLLKRECNFWKSL